jgi:ketosteroid isomerase-like protein
MPSKEDIIRAVYDRWNAGDQALDLFHPDVEWMMPYPDSQGIGREEMAAAIREYNRAWAHLHLTIEEIRALDENRMVVFFTETATGRHSGLERANESTALITFRDGLISRFEGWLHRADAYAALGWER